MLEIIVNKQKDIKTIALLENENLVEQYEEKDNSNRNEGNIFIGTVKDILPGMQSAFVDIGTEKNSFIHLKDILPQVDEKKGEKQEEKEIKNVVKINDKILVQVKKDSNAKKGARVSTHINLPSKYIVLMPNTEIITVSQKIEDKTERNRLIDIMKSNLPKGNGAVIRTSANGKSEEELVKDINYVFNKWKKILEISKKQNQEKLIYRSENIVHKMIIDLLDKDLKKIITNSKSEYDEIIAFQKEINSDNEITVELKKNEDLLDMYDIKSQIEKTSNRKIWLNCGGFITIDKTEALTAIDVNTGKFTGKKDLEETIFKVNKEATIEISKQLRLRDIGGIIIIDYIDMKDESKEKIMQLLKECLNQDRAKTQIEGFTKLDLMELTRKHICSHNE